MNDDRNASGRPNLNHNQIILQSKLRVSQSGVEMIDFVIPLGMMELHCSCPIPDEGTEGSPVYVHMKPSRGPNGARPSNARPRRPRPDNGGDDGGGDENWGNRGTYGA
jgi:hypothetical protein